MTLEDAKNYIGYGIKNGSWDESQFDEMTDAEMIEFAEKEADRSDAAYDAYKENQYDN